MSSEEPVALTPAQKTLAAVWEEHICWDQATVLVQLGLLDAANLPVSGVESASKVLDPASVPSNQLIERVEGGS